MPRHLPDARTTTLETDALPCVFVSCIFIQAMSSVWTIFSNNYRRGGNDYRIPIDIDWVTVHVPGKDSLFLFLLSRLLKMRQLDGAFFFAEASRKSTNEKVKYRGCVCGRGGGRGGGAHFAISAGSHQNISVRDFCRQYEVILTPLILLSVIHSAPYPCSYKRTDPRPKYCLLEWIYSLRTHTLVKRLWNVVEKVHVASARALTMVRSTARSTSRWASSHLRKPLTIIG